MYPSAGSIVIFTFTVIPFGTSPGNPTTASQAWTLLSKTWWKSVGVLGDQYACATNGTAGCGGMTGVTPLTLYRDWVAQTARQWGIPLSGN